MKERNIEQRLLDEMADLLNGGGINYSVSLKVYSGAAYGATDVSDIVKQLLGPAVILRGVHDAQATEVLDEIGQCLGYAGDESAQPAAHSLTTTVFSNLSTRILEGVERLSAKSAGIKSFGFMEGHPFYPVFWDFSFLFLGNEEHVLFIGSSSD